MQTIKLIFGGRSVVGSLTGTPIENEDNLAFSVDHGIKPMNGVMPFEHAPKAYARPVPRFRVVLDIGSVDA